MSNEPILIYCNSTKSQKAKGMVCRITVIANRQEAHSDFYCGNCSHGRAKLMGLEKVLNCNAFNRESDITVFLNDHDLYYDFIEIEKNDRYPSRNRDLWERIVNVLGSFKMLPNIEEKSCLKACMDDDLRIDLS